MFDSASDSALLDVMRDAQRDERVGLRARSLAAGRFTVQRIAASGQDYLDWCVDYWDVVAAEIAAELGDQPGAGVVVDGLWADVDRAAAHTG